MLGATGSFIGIIFLGSLYMQGTLGWSALETRQFGLTLVVAAAGILFIKRAQAREKRAARALDVLLLAIATVFVIGEGAHLLGFAGIHTACMAALFGIGVLPIPAL